MSENNFKEKVSKLCHDQWSNWMKYLFSKSTEMFAGGRYLPQPTIKRWKRQIDTDYEKLSKEEQDSDRREADKFIALFNEENKKIETILLSIEEESRQIKTAAIDPFIVVENAKAGLDRINALSKEALKLMQKENRNEI